MDVRDRWPRRTHRARGACVRDQRRDGTGAIDHLRARGSVIELVVLGSSGTYPTPGHPASGYLVRAADAVVLCDSGSGTFQALSAVTEPAELDAVVLSHLHPDHCSDLFALLQYVVQTNDHDVSPDVRRIDLFAPPGSADRFAAFLGAGPDHSLFKVFRFRDAVPGRVFAIGRLEIEFAVTVHPTPTVATRFQSEDRTLVYTGDTGPSADVERLAANVDVLLCEASLEQDAPPFRFHLTAAEAGSLAATAGAGRLILTHLRPGMSPDRAASQAATTFGRMPSVAAPGMRFDI